MTNLVVGKLPVGQKRKLGDPKCLNILLPLAKEPCTTLFVLAISLEWCIEDDMLSLKCDMI